MRMLMQSLVSGLTLGCLLSGAAWAEPVRLTFAPPLMERVAICKPGLPDEQIEADWAAWNGTALPEGSPESLRRDLRRLIGIDAIRWFDTVEAAYALMPAADPKFTADKALFERVHLLISAGRIKDVTNQRLIEQLMATEISNSPRTQATLAGYLMAGTGIEKDTQRATDLLVAAAFGGNADALLQIVALQQAGTEVAGWDVPQDIAVTMAFGALVGKLDPMICDRVARIGREYLAGEIVERDLAQAEAWFRFAADLGDSQAAWKVAELHLRSEDIVKSNEVLITYLTKAAEGGLSFAQVALGRLYEAGSLMPQDLPRAQQLYAKAAAFGDRAAVIRHVQFLQVQAKANPDQQTAYRAALAELVSREDAPGWAFITQADYILADKGRWAGEVEATVLFEKAAAMGDVDALKRLTPIRLRYADTPAKFYAVIDAAMQTVHLDGEIDPMNGLRATFACRAPNAPQREESLYWAEVQAATATNTVEFSPTQLLDLIRNPDPQDMARLQSQALYGRPTAIAQYMAVLDRNGASLQQRDFWAAYSLRFDKVDGSRGRLETKFANIGQAIGAPQDYLRRAVAEGDLSSGVNLAELLLRDDPKANGPEATALLEPLAAHGEGAAMMLLPTADPLTYPDLKAVYAAFAGPIAERGDFVALLVALPHLPDAASVADYKQRAISVTECTFDQAMQVTNVLGQIGDGDYQKWIDIADFLAGQDRWRLVQLADSLRSYGDDSTLPRRIGYYEAAFEVGSVTATHRLIDIYGKVGTRSFDAARATDLYVALIERVDPSEVPRALARLSKADIGIRDAAYARIDLPGLYLAAAETGNPVAMLEYGKLVRAAAATTDEVETATGWMIKSAEAGNIEAMLLAADALAFGIGVPESRDAAIGWLTKAAEAGSAEATAKLQGLTLQTKVSQ